MSSVRARAVLPCISTEALGPSALWSHFPLKGHEATRACAGILLSIMMATSSPSLFSQTKAHRSSKVGKAPSSLQAPASDAASALNDAVSTLTAALNAAAEQFAARVEIDNDLRRQAAKFTARTWALSLAGDPDLQDSDLPAWMGPVRPALRTVVEKRIGIEKFNHLPSPAKARASAPRVTRADDAIFAQTRQAIENADHLLQWRLIAGNAKRKIWDSGDLQIYAQYLGGARGSMTQFSVTALPKGNQLEIALIGLPKNYDLKVPQGTTRISEPAPRSTAVVVKDVAELRRVLADPEQFDFAAWSLKLFPELSDEHHLQEPRGASKPARVLPPANPASTAMVASADSDRAALLSLLKQSDSGKAMVAVYGQGSEETLADELVAYLGQPISREAFPRLFDISKAAMDAALSVMDPSLSGLRSIRQAVLLESFRQTQNMLRSGALSGGETVAALRAITGQPSLQQQFNDAKSSLKPGENQVGAAVRIVLNAIGIRTTAAVIRTSMLATAFPLGFLMVAISPFHPAFFIFGLGLVLAAYLTGRRQSAGAAKSWASFIMDIDFLRYGRPRTLLQWLACFSLANQPVLPLLRSLITEPRESLAYSKTVTALSRSQNLWALQAIEQNRRVLQQSDPTKALDLDGIARNIRYNAVLTKIGEGGKLAVVNPRTWPSRGDATLPIIYAALRQFPPRTFLKVADWAISDGVTTAELLDHLSRRMFPNIKVHAYDRVLALHFWKDPRDGSDLIFDSSGLLLQQVRDGRLVWARFSLAAYYPRLRPLLEAAVACFSGVRIGGRASWIADCERRIGSADPASRRQIPLLQPTLLENPSYQKHLVIHEADIQYPVSEGPFHVIRVMGLLMRDQNAYFDEPLLKHRLAMLAGTDHGLIEGGFLINGIQGTLLSPEKTFLDVYQRRGDYLFRIPQLSQGYPDNPQWDVIPLRTRMPTSKMRPPGGRANPVVASAA